MTLLVAAAASAASALVALLILVPRRLVARAQDRLARRRLDEDPGFRLLTRAERVLGRWRREPGVLGLTGDRLVFESVFGDVAELATSRIGKIETGRRLASGRDLFRLEVVRVTASAGPALEFVVTRPAAGAWRSHLGLWAAEERQADAERVVPGRA